MRQALAFVPKGEFDRVRNLNANAVNRAALFADLSRLNTLSMIACAGSGHIGSSFSSLDIVVWLLLNELKNSDRLNENGDVYFSSKGHDAPGLYSAMIACGLLPEDSLHKLRRLGGLPGHPDVGTDHIIANTGSLGMGISKAKGMAIADKRLGRQRRLFVMTGDGELQEGQFWESLVSAANHRLGVITVIVDHNKLQSDMEVTQTSDLGDLEAKFASFGWHVARCDGHDLEALATTLGKLRDIKDRPKIIIADTVKGKGVSFMEATTMKSGDNLYRYHSGAPSLKDYSRAVDELIARANGKLEELGASSLQLQEMDRPAPPAAPRSPEWLVPAYSEALIAQSEHDPRIVALDGDLILDTGLIPFRDRFPDRLLECGIAEQDMVSQAGGMASQGLLPVVHSFASFLSMRSAEQIYNNASERTKVIYVGSLAGMLPAGPGHSHQAVNDIATLGAIPGMEIAEPCCASEVAVLLDHLLQRVRGSGYLRLVSIPCDIPYVLPKDLRTTMGEGVVLRAGSDAVIIGYGPVLLPQAWHAAEMLRDQHGLEIAVVNLPWLNRVEHQWLRNIISGKRAVFTLDNHLVVGGQGRMIAANISMLGLDRMPMVQSFGLTGFPACGRDDEVLRNHGLDAESLAQRMYQALESLSVRS